MSLKIGKSYTGMFSKAKSDIYFGGELFLNQDFTSTLVFLDYERIPPQEIISQNAGVGFTGEIREGFVILTHNNNRVLNVKHGNHFDFNKYGDFETTFLSKEINLIEIFHNQIELKFDKISFRYSGLRHIIEGSKLSMLILYNLWQKEVSREQVEEPFFVFKSSGYIFTFNSGLFGSEHHLTNLNTDENNNLFLKYTEEYFVDVAKENKTTLDILEYYDIVETLELLICFLSQYSSQRLKSVGWIGNNTVDIYGKCRIHTKKNNPEKIPKPLYQFKKSDEEFFDKLFKNMWILKRKKRFLLYYVIFSPFENKKAENFILNYMQCIQQHIESIQEPSTKNEIKFEKWNNILELIENNRSNLGLKSKDISKLKKMQNPFISTVNFETQITTFLKSFDSQYFSKVDITYLCILRNKGQHGDNEFFEYLDSVNDLSRYLKLSEKLANLCLLDALEIDKVHIDSIMKFKYS
jgi:hypothetical protein